MFELLKIRNMKRILLSFPMGFAVFFLVALSSQSMAQERNLKAMNDTIDLYPGVPVVYDILAKATKTPNDTIGMIQLNGGNHITCQKIQAS